MRYEGKEGGGELFLCDGKNEDEERQSSALQAANSIVQTASRLNFCDPIPIEETLRAW